MWKNKWIVNICAALLLCGSLVYFNFIDKAAAVGAQKGNLCVDFTAKTYRAEDGKFTVSEEDFTLSKKNDKVCVINFWETWCGGCKDEMHVFNRIQEEYAGEVEVLAVLGLTSSIEYGASWLSGDGKTEEEKNNYDWSDYSLTFGYLPAESFQALGYTDSLPRTVIIDAEGVITYAEDVTLRYDLLKAEIEKALA